MATRRRTPARRTTTSRRRKSGYSVPALSISPEVARSLFGLALLILGVVTLIMIFLPASEGSLTDWAQRTVNPLFGTGRWLLPFLLMAAGASVEWGGPPAPGWQWRLVAATASYVGFLGLLEFLPVRGGGRIGTGLAGALRTVVGNDLIVVVLLIAIIVGGIVIALQRPLRVFVDPVIANIRVLMSRPDTAAKPASRTKAEPISKPMAPSRLDPREPSPTRSILDEPAPPSGMAQTSQTFAFGGGARDPSGAPAGPASVGATAVAVRPRIETEEPPTALESLQAIDWELPSIELLDARPAATATPPDHTTNTKRIEEKLLSFAIPAKVVKVNSGPVVTQYEVKPEHHVKVSRIEALADDLAMALSARSIRIEAPIPGKDVVGIEIPNQVSEVVGFRPLVEETSMLTASSPLTFALGRDVSGKSIAVDLAKMPHLLVAGATGSGKSVCVNALITSLLMRARPDEVRMILVDLKRVELAPYNGLPHLLQHVIVEPNEAKGVLNWAVREMEERYKLLAGHGVRNIAAFNARPDAQSADGDERMPYIVLIIDELADLIMREGRKVEDPVVKIAQKARAVGIHLVLATQRPSVNVVTGLIKANVPSRIAFAMASMVDSRTVLDAPGAEDLIGRGDMLYQPVDLPRPLRMQGVFVGDREVANVTRHWLDQTGGRTFYDEDILAYADGEDGGAGDGGQFAWLRKYGVDEMTVPAAELVMTSQRASTSMLQTKLKLGFARASRVMDELERYGLIGPQDPRNPATPRHIYGPDNWLRTIDDGDGSDE
ncbi:MAG TPA: DNA translocase FtsK [Candidatus Limnocylindrales bacterium]|nr:DNA translocase FtsK [Candidatus Limnocylindrales bacterium]